MRQQRINIHSFIPWVLYFQGFYNLSGSWYLYLNCWLFCATHFSLSLPLSFDFSIFFNFYLIVTCPKNSDAFFLTVLIRSECLCNFFENLHQASEVYKLAKIYQVKIHNLHLLMRPTVTYIINTSVWTKKFLCFRICCVKPGMLTDR